jgi:hypothetical protein
MRDAGWYWVNEASEWKALHWTGDMWIVCDTEVDFIVDADFKPGTLIDETKIIHNKSDNITTITKEQHSVHQKNKEINVSNFLLDWDSLP